MKQVGSIKRSSFTLAVMSLLLVYTCLTACQATTSTIVLGTKNSPCWYEICPGSTTKQQARETLTNIPEVDSATIGDKEVNTEHTYLYWGFTNTVVERSGEIYYQDGVVTRIRMRTGEPLILDKVVEMFGNPEHVLVTSGCSDTRWLWAGLFWPDLGLKTTIFDSQLRSTETPEIVSEQAVAEVEFFAPQLYDEVLRRSEGVWSDLQNEIPLHLKKWSGYGEVDYWDVCR